MPPRPERALLFDIDGTLADTDPLHLQAFNLVLGPLGHVFDHGSFASELQGFSNASISARFLPDEPPDRQAAIMDRKEGTFRQLVSGQVEPTPGLLALLTRAEQANIPMVAVTNAPRLNAEMLLAGLGIMHRFKAVVIADELPHSKPHPLPYLEGLRAVNAAPHLSVAFEELALRHQVGLRCGHCDGGNPHQPQPWRSDRSGRTPDCQLVRRSGPDRVCGDDNELVRQGAPGGRPCHPAIPRRR